MQDKITGAIAGGIHKFVKPYNEPAENIQIVFKLDASGNVEFFTCVQQKLKHSVRLEYLIGKNIYNLVVRKHIKKLLQKFASETGLPDNQINLMAGIKAQDHVYVWLRKDNQLIRQIKDEELK